MSRLFYSRDNYIDFSLLDNLPWCSLSGLGDPERGWLPRRRSTRTLGLCPRSPRPQTAPSARRTVSPFYPETTETFNGKRFKNQLRKMTGVPVKIIFLCRKSRMWSEKDQGNVTKRRDEFTHIIKYFTVPKTNNKRPVHITIWKVQKI